MFHVASLLPKTIDPQQLERKRHIGNDIVVVVFDDRDDNDNSDDTRAMPFAAEHVNSHFNHVFVVVRRATRDEIAAVAVDCNGIDDATSMRFVVDKILFKNCEKSLAQVEKLDVRRSSFFLLLKEIKSIAKY